MGTNTGIGIGIGIPFRNNALGGDNIYFPPELKARMIGVWDNYGKKNTDADRNIIKNKIPNAGGDLEILNSAYKLNSGFGEYREDFTSWIVSKEPMTVEKTDSQVHISYIGTSYKELPMFEYSGPINENYSLTVEIQGIPNNVIGKFIHNNGFTQEVTNGINTIKFSNSGSWYGFTFYREDNTIIGDCNITIKQIPAFEGALVTDGINDIIASIKTLEDWNIGNKGITIVSMIHQINTNTNNFITTNNIRTDNKIIGRNIVSNIEKTGIYGWYKENIQSDTINVINNILGDKNDYTSHSSPSTNINPINNSKFYVQGYAIENGFAELSSVAHYWTFAVLGKATEDEINLIIAKYNLDRTLRPDILCNITKQGITNDNHADFNDKLVDYSGNGRDIQMYNLVWKGSSGVAAKKFETIKDYLIVPDEGLQELTIYNEFSYKVKSIKHADRYWTIQSLNKTDVSYPITIVSNKNIIWRNVINYTDENGVKRSIRKETNVPANTPTQVFVLGFNDFDVPDNYTKVNCVAYATRTDITEFTVTFIPSHKGGLLLDGINDFDKVTGMPIYKDYTVVADREIEASDGGIVSKGNPGAFILELEANAGSCYSFGLNATNLNIEKSRKISYLSKYLYNGVSIEAGTAEDSDSMWLGTIRDKDSRFFNGAIYSLMSFPYSMSEFLIERQLKKHKLGTLYPNMVEFRPVIKANANYKITYYQIDSTNTWKSIKVGDYIVIGAKLAFQITFDNDASELKEVVSPQLSGIIVEKRPSNPGYNIYSYITSKSPQKINITIDEYIRFEDIVQPYPVVFQIKDRNTNQIYSWGDKIKVGSSIQLSQGEKPNLLSELYSIQSYEYEGETYSYNQLTNLNIILTKQSISLSCNKIWLLDDNEPKCILSPRLLRIPNSSYKILGYIPDISGHGNNGVIHNSAYAEGSGVNEDGSFQFDGVDDFVTIPTTVGSKQVLMKVNWNSLNHVLYDQRNNAEAPFCIVAASGTIAYNQRNVGGNTYIDGILNNHILVDDLQAITHNIVLNNDYNVANSNSFIGTNYTKSIYAKMSLYDFMLFDEISTEAKIKELNEYVGIEAKVELPPYYWDAYGKTNLDGDKATIQQRGVAVGDYGLTNYNHAYEGMSGYNGYPVVFGSNKTWENFSSVYSYISDVTSTTIHITRVKNAGVGLLFSYVKKDGALTNIREIPAFRVTVKGLEGNSKFGYRYLDTEDATRETLVYLGNGTHELAKSFAPTEALLDLTSNAWVGIFITPMVEDEAVFDCDITIEVLPEYENGLVYDAITDYSKNANIPALDDFTAIIKREWLKKQGCPLIKGSKVYEGGNGNALLLEWDKAYNFVFYKRTDIMEGEVPDNISFITPTNYNGNVITRGSEQDTNGICIAGDGNAGFANMVFYKLILYPKTIPLLQINFLKNLMEKDEIIDLTNPIFIKDE